VTDICTLYQEAPERAARGERMMTTDELTGVQALEPTHPDLPPAPGKPRCRAFEYVRHGTQTFILNRRRGQRPDRGPLVRPHAHGGGLRRAHRAHHRHRSRRAGLALRGGQSQHPSIRSPGTPGCRPGGASRRYGRPSRAGQRRFSRQELQRARLDAT
jgi:hypothetical protein